MSGKSAGTSAVLMAAALAALTGCACPASPSTSAEPPSVVHTEVSGLEKLVRLPKPPLAARWRTALLSEPGLGPTDWELVAVLDYPEGDATALLAGLTPAPGPRSERWSPGAAAWLTPAVTSALTAAPAGDAAPLGRSPLLTGWAARVPDAGTVVLRLQTR